MENINMENAGLNFNSFPNSSRKLTKNLTKNNYNFTI